MNENIEYFDEDYMQCLSQFDENILEYLDNFYQNQNLDLDYVIEGYNAQSIKYVIDNLDEMLCFYVENESTIKKLFDIMAELKTEGNLGCSKTTLKDAHSMITLMNNIRELFAARLAAYNLFEKILQSDYREYLFAKPLYRRDNKPLRYSASMFYETKQLS